MDSVQRLDRFELAASDLTTPEAVRQDPTLTWYPAVVPGGVHESLIAAGRIEHPYYGDNMEAARWIDDETWWYRTAFDFDAPDGLDGDERLRLVCESLDTVAEIWLNGELVGSHESQFRPAVLDVTGQVRAHNELLIRFTPPLAGLTTPPEVANTLEKMKALFGLLVQDGQPEDPEAEQPPGVMSANLALTLRRKGTFSWGWDFGPRLPAIGLAGVVQLRRERGAVLSGHHIRATSVDVAAATATVAVDVEADAFGHSGAMNALVTLTAPNGRVHRAELDLGDGRAGAVLDIDDAQLWWSHDLGEQPLYDVVIELTGKDGLLLDRAEDRIGLRTVTLDRSADEEGGRLFRFVLNGVPLFARGANWVPVSMMTGSVTAETVRALVEAAKRGNMNMLRVWGGGVYEQDGFYRSCDDLGVLVWQDFMFACIDYPSDDPALHAEVVREAEYQVKRLRNRASMALWAGNNEVTGIHQLVYQNTDPGNWGWSFFHEVLPSAVTRFNPEVPYWPGSPWGEDDPYGINGVLDGDRHAWEVWHGVDLGVGGPTEFASKGEEVHFDRYRYDKGKFISEFGIHATAELGTLARWTPPGSLALHSPEFDNRNKDVPKNKGDDLMSVETGLPTDLEQYVDFSMACQAEGLKFGIEHYRRRQPHCSGTLLWQLNEPWPGLSWSIIDHDLIAKAGYYFTQRAYRPVLASFVRTDDGGIQLWVSNSGRTPVELRLRVEVAGFAGEQFVDEYLDLVAAPGSSRPVWSAPAAAFGPGPDRFAWVSDGAGRIEPNRLFFGPLKDLPLTLGEVETRIEPGAADGTAEVVLTSHGYSYLTRVLAPAPGVTFDRNYLDLRDGQQARILVGGLPKDFDPADLHIAGYGRP
ncbi:glycoside hydrolase family 2 protein [Streptacidiphilus sp. PAMC 29251]